MGDTVFPTEHLLKTYISTWRQFRAPERFHDDGGDPPHVVQSIQYWSQVMTKTDDFTTPFTQWLYSLNWSQSQAGREMFRVLPHFRGCLQEMTEVKNLTYPLRLKHCERRRSYASDNRSDEWCHLGSSLHLSALDEYAPHNFEKVPSIASLTTYAVKRGKNRDMVNGRLNGLTQLSSLYLRQCSERFDDSLFHQMSNLRVLSIDALNPKFRGSDYSFAALSGLQKLHLFDCEDRFSTLTTNAFSHLSSLQSLVIYRLHGESCLTNTVFQHMSQLRRLSLVRCGAHLTEELFTPLTNLRQLRIGYTDVQLTTHRPFQHLTSLEQLSINHTHEGLSNEAFQDLSVLRSLSVTEIPFEEEMEDEEMEEGREPTMSDRAFSHLSQLTYLHVNTRTKKDDPHLTSHLFTHLGKLKCLYVQSIRPELTRRVVPYLSKLKILNAPSIWNYASNTPPPINLKELPQLHTIEPEELRHRLSVVCQMHEFEQQPVQQIRQLSFFDIFVEICGCGSPRLVKRSVQLLEKLINTQQQYSYEYYKQVMYLGLTKAIGKTAISNLWTPLFECALGKETLRTYGCSKDFECPLLYGDTQLEWPPLSGAIMMGRWRCLRQMAKDPIFQERATRKIRKTYSLQTMQRWRTRTKRVLRSHYGISELSENTNRSSSSDSDFDESDCTSSDDSTGSNSNEE